MRLAPVAIVLLTLPLLGCGSAGSDRVEGMVTFDGTPVEAGEIVFMPVDGNGGVGAGQIVDGKYSVECPPGDKKVQITATRVEGKAADGLDKYVAYIPKKYNDQTTLTATIERGSNKAVDFTLEP